MDLKQFLHQRNLGPTFHDRYGGSDDESVYCQACYEVIKGPAYVYREYIYARLTFALHKTCAETPGVIQHPLHPDFPLEADWETLASLVPRKGFLCKGCGHYSFGFGYGCRGCDFKLDIKCATNLQIQLVKILEIKEDFHDHKLQRFHHNKLALPSTDDYNVFRDIICSFCKKQFNGPVFSCTSCNLFIHERCIHKLPNCNEIRSPYHLDHPLVLGLTEFGGGMCQACYGSSWRGHLFLTCPECPVPVGFHISCCSHNTFGLRLKQYHEQHPMLYVYSGGGVLSEFRKCVVCNANCEDCHVYACLGCDVFVHLECIPLPSVVKHESHSYDDHVLTLSDLTNLRDTVSDKYHCIICEKKGDLNHPFYHCQQCSDIAHVDCVLSEEDPPLEIVEYLVPRATVKYETNSMGESCVNESDEESVEEQVDLECFSLDEIDKRLAVMVKKMDKLTLQLAVHQEARVKKLNINLNSPSE